MMRAMRTLVQFGAGNIGRGFIAPTFAAAGWRVVFVDIDGQRIAALRGRGSYRVTEVDNHGRREVAVAPVDGLDARDGAAVAEALAQCDLAATAVGLAALRHLGANLAAGLARRLDLGRGPLDVLVCENGAQAHAELRAAVLAAAPAGRGAALDAALGTVRTSIGRMIPAATGGDPLDLQAEPYAKLPVERAAFRGQVPALANLVAVDDFELVLGQKLYLHNLTHACLAYAGHLAGCATIPECMDDGALVAGAAAAGNEAGEALARAHGRDQAQRAAIRRECLALVESLLARYRNQALNDPVARVARDPWRKLAADDRLVGAARLCLQQGVAPTAIIRHLVFACRYAPAPDEPRAAEWNRLRAQGPGALLAAVAGLEARDPLLAAVVLEHRRQQAARALRAASLALSDEEAASLVIADFGLGRYEQFGLAIHTYVNTRRCCAKEVVMLPGQICPEHHHPPLPGDPGKEETFRVRQGLVHLFLPGHRDDGQERAFALAKVPADKHGAMTVFRHVLLRPGDQYTLLPDVLHWFVAGPEGAIASEFSTHAFDQADVYTDEEVERSRRAGGADGRAMK
jgi:mannitol-1-phosphate 5-dehydrogenase